MDIACAAIYLYTLMQTLLSANQSARTIFSFFLMMNVDDHWYV